LRNPNIAERDSDLVKCMWLTMMVAIQRTGMDKTNNKKDEEYPTSIITGMLRLFQFFIKVMIQHNSQHVRQLNQAVRVLTHFTLKPSVSGDDATCRYQRQDELRCFPTRRGMLRSATAMLPKPSPSLSEATDCHVTFLQTFGQSQ
jgi:hypothetical protein